MDVKSNHPLAEILAKKLFGFEGVPVVEQKRMINRAISAAIEYHESEIQRAVENNIELEYIQDIKNFYRKQKDSYNL